MLVWNVTRLHPLTRGGGGGGEGLGTLRNHDNDGNGNVKKQSV